MNKEILGNGLRKLAGILLIIFGVLGLFLPFLQGVAMIIAGAYLLGNKQLVTWIKRQVRRIRT